MYGQHADMSSVHGSVHGKGQRADMCTDMVHQLSKISTRTVHGDEAIQVEVPIVRRGPTTQSGTRALREGFTKAVQHILDQDGQTDQDQLLIEKMVQLKIQDQAGPKEVQDAADPIQFRLNQAGLLISTSELDFGLMFQPHFRPACLRPFIFESPTGNKREQPNLIKLQTTKLVAILHLHSIHRFALRVIHIQQAKSHSYPPPSTVLVERDTHPATRIHPPYFYPSFEPDRPTPSPSRPSSRPIAVRPSCPVRVPEPQTVRPCRLFPGLYHFGIRAQSSYTFGDMGDLNGAPTQAEINAQLMANHAELQAALATVTEQLAHIAGRDRANVPRPRRRNNPVPEEQQSQSSEDNSDTDRTEPEEPRRERAIRFTKAVQHILDQDGQTDQDQLLIEKMVQLKIQDQAGPKEVQDAADPIQFRLNQAGLLISTSELDFGLMFQPHFRPAFFFCEKQERAADLIKLQTTKLVAILHLHSIHRFALRVIHIQQAKSHSYPPPSTVLVERDTHPATRIHPPYFYPSFVLFYLSSYSSSFFHSLLKLIKSHICFCSSLIIFILLFFIAKPSHSPVRAQTPSPSRPSSRPIAVRPSCPVRFPEPQTVRPCRLFPGLYHFGIRAQSSYTFGDMGDLNGAPTQAEINAQLMANHAELQAALATVTEQLAHIAGRDRANVPRPRRRNQPVPEEQQSQSSEDNSDTDRTEPEEPRRERAGRFTKAVQHILDQDGQTDQDQLLIEKMVQLKIQDQAGPKEVQDAADPIQNKREQPNLIKLQTTKLVAILHLHSIHRFALRVIHIQQAKSHSYPPPSTVLVERDTHPATRIHPPYFYPSLEPDRPTPSPSRPSSRPIAVHCSDVLRVLTDVRADGRPVCADGRPVCTDGHTHTDSHGRPACADGRPVCADGRPVCADGRPVCTDGHTDTHGHTRTATDVLRGLTDVLRVLTDVLCVLTDVLCALTDTRTHTDSRGRPACADGRPACADGRPVCADGRPVCTDGHTDTHGQPRTQPTWAKITRTATERADMCTDGQPDVLCVLTDGHGRPVCADGRPRTSSHVGQNHPRTAKITREAKDAKINIFEESFLKGNIKNMSTKSLGCQVLIKSCCRHPFRPRNSDLCIMQKTWLEAKEIYENLPENSFNHPYEACKKSDSNSKYFFFYIKNTPRNTTNGYW
ncbi:hypothetical protein IGI04_036636 [Brassica rapa subsp. trilocularis]|uniref:Uncharacterized protein n=1 Tax=Brassica rapa subsp. trilocularis TaxID=1813537 RepID=A0ABQ7LHA3_BRACM|nr:hypothetical protein IGI04_036636 [Brassica rapa subsp. trilocularis]